MPVKNSRKEERISLFYVFAMNVIDKQERIALNVKEKLFYDEGSKTGVQTQCGLFITGNFKKKIARLPGMSNAQLIWPWSKVINKVFSLFSSISPDFVVEEQEHWFSWSLLESCYWKIRRDLIEQQASPTSWMWVRKLNACKLSPTGLIFYQVDCFKSAESSVCVLSNGWHKREFVLKRSLL